MDILLDTHIAIWALLDSPDLPASARSLVADADNEIYVSDVSAWEVAVKKVARPSSIPCDAERFLDKCEEAGYRFLPLSHAALIAYGRLDYSKAADAHKDPFDRMLVAQSKCSNMLLITHDRSLTLYGEPLVSVV